MMKIAGISAKQEDWDVFFKLKGLTWRNKDYVFLSSVFELNNFFGNLLDVGCGLGDGILYLKKKCPNVSSFSGCDVSVQAIKSCNTNPALSFASFFVQDISKSLLKKYDFIICLQTLEHLPDPLVALKNLIDATKYALVVSTPYKNRRPDTMHIWSFNKHDFKGYFDSYCIAQEYTNIFGILDKLKLGYKFKKKHIIFRFTDYSLLLKNKVISFVRALVKKLI